MTVIRNKKLIAIPEKILLDKKLSYQAKGFWCYLYAKTESECSCYTDSYYEESILHELELCGYAKMLPDKTIILTGAD